MTDDSLAKLTEQLDCFAKERDWVQFDTPKNLAMALTVEAAELLKPFQWLTAEESAGLSAKRKTIIRPRKSSKCGRKFETGTKAI